MTENDFLRQLKQRYANSEFVDIGIGDDGAVLKSHQGRSQVVVTDMLLDGVHFDLSQTAPRLAARKAMAVNLSDLAAMGCRPTAAFVSIAIPRSLPHPLTSQEFLDDVYRGFDDILSEFAFTIAGGDTNSWTGPFAVNVCLTGIPMSENGLCFLRSGAKQGDVLLVSGPLGGSLVQNRHLTFEPRLRLAEWLAQQTTNDSLSINAAMDISDGLSTDLLRMMEASGTSATIEGAAVPIHLDVDASWTALRRLQAALSDGEDFELLLSVSPDLSNKLMTDARLAGFNLIPIGKVQAAGVSMIQTSEGKAPLISTGWQHTM